MPNLTIHLLREGDQNSRVQVGLSSAAADFGIDIERDLIKGIVGYPIGKKAALLGRRMSGSDALTVSRDINLKTIRMAIASGRYPARSTSLSFRKPLPMVTVETSGPSVFSSSMGGGEAPAAHTLSKHRQRLSVFINFLLDNDHLQKNPLKGIAKTSKFDTEDDTGRAFTQAELDAIFEPVALGEWSSKYPHRLWAPMIGLYTGARITEVSQLYVVNDGLTNRRAAEIKLWKTP